jgi:hypothetical protein
MIDGSGTCVGGPGGVIIGTILSLLYTRNPSPYYTQETPALRRSGPGLLERSHRAAEYYKISPFTASANLR